MIELSYQLSRGKTEILIEKGSLNILSKLQERSFVVYPAGLQGMVEPLLDSSKHVFFPLDDGEDGKDVDSVIDICRKLSEEGFKRGSTLVSVGGGSTSDVAGMAASIYMRGMKLISFPTTLLAMVDASLGGKTGVNLRGIKNMIGTFYSPSRVIIDPEIIKSLPENLMADGLGEIAKYAIAMDNELFEALLNNGCGLFMSDNRDLEHWIARCVKIKMDVVSKDEFELTGERSILNFGHTVGHAIEASSGFSISHGVSVAYGMMFELDMGLKMGLTPENTVTRAKDLLKKLNLPSRIHNGQFKEHKNSVLDLIYSDKKTSGKKIRIPIPDRIGHCDLVEIDTEDVRNYLESAIK